MKLSKEMQEALDNPAVHNFLKDILKGAAGRDIVDVLHDLEFAQYLVNKHLDNTLENLKAVFA